MKREEFELDSALRWAQIPELPGEWTEADDKRPVWVRAIAETTNRNGTKSWAIVRNKPGQQPTVEKSFSISAIARIDKIYPYEKVDERFYPQVYKKEDTVKFIATTYNVSIASVKKLSDVKISRLLDNYAIQMYLEQKRGEKRYQEAADRARES